MLEFLNRIEQQIEQEDLTLELLRVGKALMQRQEAILHEQQCIFFGLCSLVLIVMAFQVFTIKYWRK